MFTRRRVFIGLLLLLAYVVWLPIYTILRLALPWFPLLVPPGPFALMLSATIMFVIGVPCYFLPTLIGRKKRNARALFALNLLLGWTFLGWVGALVWALLRDRKDAEAAQQPGVTNGETDGR